ncbi:uncharacterized protein BJX67DRAFT_366843 [Aspergillus lucknowensis]|uniref:Uncharacterized protein n=1 Tax=Aspergillus lucknowensis TaxID=176173 RepID=A0ABR4LFJ3_9EURO
MVSASLRNRLHSLWQSLLGPGINHHIENDSIVSQKFLDDNSITLSPYLFSCYGTESQNLNRTPPILFQKRGPEIINNYPINYAAKFPPKDNPLPSVKVGNIFQNERIWFYRGTAIARYMDRWGMAGFPRVLPSGYPDLGSLCGIAATGDPHALNVETPGLNNYSFVGPKWQTYLYESNQYQPDGSSIHPHLILLGVQSTNAHSGTISLGELTTIVTAMRCRAYQPAVFDVDAVLAGEVEQPEDGNPAPSNEDDLAFKDEKRFPVLMVSLIGPQHVRVIYACMDGLKLCVRMSELTRIEPTNELLFRNIASVLLSIPLVESI